MVVGLSSSLHIQSTFARGLDGQQHPTSMPVGPRTYDEFVTAVGSQFKFSNLITSTAHLFSAMTIGTFGGMLGAGLARRVGAGGLGLGIAALLSDEALTATVTGYLRSQVTQESYGQAYRRDFLTGMGARSLLLLSLRPVVKAFARRSLPIRFLNYAFISTSMALSNWLAEAVVEDLPSSDRGHWGWEAAYRLFMSAMMVGQGHALRLPGTRYSLNADDWTTIRKLKWQAYGLPHAGDLAPVLMDSNTSLASGYPILSEKSFRHFQENLPHLFRNGNTLYNQVERVEQRVREIPGLDPELRDNTLRATKVVRQVLNTAAITAPPTLWTLRHVLSTYKRLGILDRLSRPEGLHLRNFATQTRWSCLTLDYDLQLLHSRGYLDRTKDGYRTASSEAGRVMDKVVELDPQFLKVNWATEIKALLDGDYFDADRTMRLAEWLTLPGSDQPLKGWEASWHDIEIGYRLTPLLLALDAKGMTSSLKKGDAFPTKDMPARGINDVLTRAGLIQGDTVTALGARVFQKGSGPFGIIHSYYGYVQKHEGFLKAIQLGTPRVERTENIGSSANANAGNLKKAVGQVFRLMDKQGFKPTVVVEHAFGQGVALKEFDRIATERGMTDDIAYVGADYDQRALEVSSRMVAEGQLPTKTQLIHSDIGNPRKLVADMKEKGIDVSRPVMIVGDGFQEIRGKTSDGMVEIFKQYREAGFTLMFIETSYLGDDLLRDTGWMTYHPAFRYFHQMSGQELRPPWEMYGWKRVEFPGYSWLTIGDIADYRYDRRFSVQTRPLSPRSVRPDDNPPLQVTFCFRP